MVEQSTAKDWLADIIHDGFYDKLVIIGFPYDDAINGSARQGSDLGPGKSQTLTTCRLIQTVC
jgi:hypothetical protein